MFDEIHEKYPDVHILYLAYSAVTTCSFQSAMIMAEGKDYITLMTCTPYGINTHRLLVRGTRIENTKQKTYIT